MSRVGVVVVGACVLWALGACGSCGATTSPAAFTQADLAAARISGQWQLTVTVDSYTGPAPPASDVFQPGHSGADKVVLVSTCASAGACTLQLWGPGGPDPSQASYYRFYSNATGLLGPPVSTPMVESGASYSQAIPISGFGGAKCARSKTVRAPDQRLTLTVTGATRSGSGWSATRLIGTETFVAGWGCSGGTFSGWTVGHLKIVGTPH